MRYEIKWVTDNLPEENKMLLVFDNIEGLEIGYYSSMGQTFYTLDNMKLDNVCAWIYVPEKPKDFSRIVDKVRNRNFIEVVYKDKNGGTEDV